MKSALKGQGIQKLVYTIWLIKALMIIRARL